MRVGAISMPPEDHGQLRRGDGEFRGCGRGESERALLQSAEIEGEAIAHPAQDLELVTPLVLEDENVAGCGIAAEQDADHTKRAQVESLGSSVCRSFTPP